MQGRHCPFLNRNDSRCAQHFSVNRLKQAFDHCFSDYATCSTYRELLSERSGRAAEHGHAEPAATRSDSRVIVLTIRGRHAETFQQLRHCGHQPAA